MSNLFSDKKYFVELNNGLKIPSIGFGTANTREDVCENSVKLALESGYKLIDTASQYKNERPVGLAVNNACVPRNEIFISSKLWNDVCTYDDVMYAFEQSLKWLNIDYMDIFLIHWPNPIAFREQGYEKRNYDVWHAMEDLYYQGKIRAIGVSNFKIHHLLSLERNARVMPMLNQICIHPGNYPIDIIDYCKKNNILLQAYCPLGAGRIMNNDILNNIAQKYKKTVAQICLRWHFQNRIIPLPKSSTPERIKSNLEIMDFKLSEKEMILLNQMSLNIKILPDPDEANF